MLGSSHRFSHRVSSTKLTLTCRSRGAPGTRTGSGERRRAGKCGDVVLSSLRESRAAIGDYNLRDRLR